jgi:hypothetical protein
VAYAAFLDRLCWRLAVYRSGDCERCDGDLEVWTDGTRLIRVCDSLGCSFDSAGRHIGSPPGNLRPATRTEITADNASAPLVAVGD